MAGSRLSLGTTRLGNIESYHTHLVAGVAVRASGYFAATVNGKF